MVVLKAIMEVDAQECEHVDKDTSFNCIITMAIYRTN